MWKTKVILKGDIAFPVLGKIHVGGLSREEGASPIKDRLFKEDLVKDAVVSVEFGGLHFSVLGEVNKPGQYNFENDRETILDAISRAGDLTIYGQRDHVTVIRTEGGERKVYNINMLSGQDITNSPAQRWLEAILATFFAPAYWTAEGPTDTTRVLTCAEALRARAAAARDSNTFFILLVVDNLVFAPRRGG